MASDILWYIAHPIFALVVALIISALQIAGVIKMIPARILLFIAWLISTASVGAYLNNAPIQHRLIAALLMGLPLGLCLLLLERWITKTVEKRDAKTTIDAKQTEEPKPESPKPTPEIKFEAFMMPTEPQYQSRKKVAGISWRKNYSDVRLNITNGAIPIRNVDLYIALDTQIASIKQVSNLSGVSTFPEGGIPPILLSGTNEKGKPVAIPLMPIQEDSPAPIYRIQCQRLSSNTVLQFIIAGIAVNPPKPDGSLPDTLFPPKRDPQAVQIKGTLETSAVEGIERYNVEFSYEFKKDE